MPKPTVTTSTEKNKQTESPSVMKTQQNNSVESPHNTTDTTNGQATVISTGTGAYGEPCAEAPRGKHSFRDISSKPGRDKGERLVTSQCKYCNGLVVDIPTLSAF